MTIAVIQSERRRDDPRRAVTRSALIEAAERLFAEAGVEAVSTRQIGAAIGALNTNVVAYHFGSKEGLIEAVFRHRLPAIDRLRSELVRKLDAAGQSDNLSALLRAFALPLFEQTDSAGQHSYARFLLGLERSGMLAARALVRSDFPQTEGLTSRMAALLPPEVRQTANFRMRLIFAMLGSALQVIDQEPELSADEARQLFDHAIAMAATAYSALPTAEESLL